MNEQIYLRIYAKDDATPVLNRFNQGLKTTSAEAAKTKASVMGATEGFGSMGRSAGQAGIQIQQFVGQVQAGTNPLLALSQQAADLGFVLGAPLVGAVAGLAASFAMVLLPSLFEAKDSIEDVVDMMDELTDKTSELTVAQRKLKQQIATDAIEGYAEKIKDLQEDLINFERQSIWEDLQEKDIRRINEIKATIDTYQQKITELTGEIKDLNSTTEEQSEADKKRETGLQRLIRATQEEAETLGMTNTQLRIYQARQLGASDADIERLQSLGMVIEAHEAQLEKEKEIEAFKKQYDKDRKKANADMLKEQAELLKETERQLKPIEDSFVNMINGTKGVKNAFRDMARSIIDDLIRIQIQQTITKPLAGLLAGFGGLGGIMGGLNGTAGGGAKASGAGQYMGFNFEGGGYTGSGARSGGLDGKGGFMAMVHPNETVVDHTKGGGSGVVINQTINVTTGVQQTVRTEIAQLMPKIAEASKAAVLDARKRGGSYSAAFGG